MILKNKVQSLDELKNEIKKYKEEKEKYSLLQEKAKSALDKYNNLNDEYSMKYTAFLSEQAGIMASGLKTVSLVLFAAQKIILIGQ